MKALFCGKASICLIVLTCGASLFSRAESNDDLAATAATTLEKVFSNFKPITSLKFSAEKEVKSKSSTYQNSIDYFSQGNLYSYTLSLGVAPGGKGDSYSCAFDGKNSFFYRSNASQVAVKKGDDMDNSISDGELGPLNLFAFLLAASYKNEAQKGFPILTASILADEERWHKLASTVTGIVQVKWNGISTVRLTVPGGEIPSIPGATIFKVYLDPKNNYFPVGWERLGKIGNVESIATFRVAKLARVHADNSDVTMSYPSEIEFTVDVNGKNVTSGGIKTTSFSINKQFEPSEFSFDLSSANTVVDWDNNVYINVPK